MVPPVLITRTLASADGVCSGSMYSTELQLDNFLLRFGCTWTLLGVETSGTSCSVGCDKARASDFRLQSAMMIYKWADAAPLKVFKTQGSSSAVGALKHGTVSPGFYTGSSFHRYHVMQMAEGGTIVLIILQCSQHLTLPYLQDPSVILPLKRWWTVSTLTSVLWVWPRGQQCHSKTPAWCKRLLCSALQ